MLERVPTAEEIRNMDTKALNALSADLRSFLVEKTAQKGGHLASNLGAVELTVALFSVFDFPRDRVIFDVGHQSYTYKILSGRKDGFDHLRDLNGLSGFPKRNESPYDAFDTGHSSTSISAGLGMVTGRDLRGEDYNVISVIGDGSFTGGEVYEALNNAARLHSNYIIILNDNEMSISKNVGGMNRYLTNLRAGKGYNRAKDNVKRVLRSLPRIGENLVTGISNFKDSIKEIVIPRGMFFENLGITYLGPVNGHNIPEMQRIFKKAKELNRCVLIHVKTVKGKGYEPAEKKPEWFHGVNPFDIATGLPKKTPQGRSYSQVFGAFLDRAADAHPEVIGITAAMTENVGLTDYAAHHPERFFDVGIAEQHAVTFAAGLAVSGLHPYFAVFSSFLQRGFDQIVHDVAMQKLKVTFAIDRAGIVGRDGETHQGTFDIAYLLPVPNMTVMLPKDALEMEAMLEYSLRIDGPSTVRYPRGTAVEDVSSKFSWDCTPMAATDVLSDRLNPEIRSGKAEILTVGRDLDEFHSSGDRNPSGRKIVLLSFGTMFETAGKVCEKLTERHIFPAVVNMRFAKPFDEELVLTLSKEVLLFVTLEDGALRGGIGETVSAFLSSRGFDGKIINIGIPDRFVPQGNPEDLYRLLGMDADSVVTKIMEVLA